MRTELAMLAFCLLVVQTLGMTTPMTHKPHHHKTHPTVERPVSESFSFKYDPKTHLMAAITRHNCYVYSMSAQESVDVHSAHGLRSLETKLITMVDDTTLTYQVMTVAQMNATSPYLAHTCSRKGWTAYQLN